MSQGDCWLICTRCLTTHPSGRAYRVPLNSGVRCKYGYSTAKRIVSGLSTLAVPHSCRCYRVGWARCGCRWSTCVVVSRRRFSEVANAPRSSRHRLVNSFGVGVDHLRPAAGFRVLAVCLAKGLHGVRHRSANGFVHVTTHSSGWLRGCLTQTLGFKA